MELIKVINSKIIIIFINNLSKLNLSISYLSKIYKVCSLFSIILLHIPIYNNINIFDMSKILMIFALFYLIYILIN
jgi:hypothetical protein